MKEYINIYGNNTITPWFCNIYNKSYADMPGYEESVDIGYTKILVEVPEALWGASIISSYWTSEPIGMTKFYNSLTTTPSKVFQTSFNIEESTLKVYLNGIIIPINITGINMFEIDGIQPDGYLWIEYVVSEADANKAISNTKDTLEAKGGIIAQYVMPEFDFDIIIKLRRIINNLEAYLDMLPTTWIGGADNIIRSTPNNIISGLTPIFADHLKELVYAVQKIEQDLDTKVPIRIPRYLFSKISYTSTYMIKYLEEIMEDLMSLEKIILNPEYYS